jgi:pyruvate dehydrogenase (quinone)
VRLARAAIKNAVGKQGAAVLVLPGDILYLHSDGRVPTSVVVTERPRPVPSEATIAELARRIGEAEKVAIFAGLGCAGARHGVLELAARLNAPMGHTLRGKESRRFISDGTEYVRPASIAIRELGCRAASRWRSTLS